VKRRAWAHSIYDPLRQESWLARGEDFNRKDGETYWKSTKFIFGMNAVLSNRDAIRDLEVLVVAQ